MIHLKLALVATINFTGYLLFDRMTIKIEKHTLDRASERGASEIEIMEVLDSGFAINAKNERFGKAKVFAFNDIRNNKYYKHKRVEVIYTIQDNIIVTVTVYVFYGEWELI